MTSAEGNRVSPTLVKKHAEYNYNWESEDFKKEKMKFRNHLASCEMCRKLMRIVDMICYGSPTSTISLLDYDFIMEHAEIMATGHESYKEEKANNEKFNKHQTSCEMCRKLRAKMLGTEPIRGEIKTC